MTKKKNEEIKRLTIKVAHQDRTIKHLEERVEEMEKRLEWSIDN